MAVLPTHSIAMPITPWAPRKPFTDSFTYTVTDGALTDSATITFTIDGENDTPVATDNTYNVGENATQVTGNFITDDTGAGTDSDPEGDPLSIPATALTVTTSQGVTLTLGSDGSFTYPLDSTTNNTLSATETFTDSVTYIVTDGTLTDSATVTFTIDGENDAPVATDNSYTVSENDTQVTGNVITDDTGAGTDSDAESDPLTIPATALTVTTSQGVTLTLGTDGSFTYPLDSNANNTLGATETFTDSFTYTVTDGALTDSATITFTIDGENDTPVATDNTYNVGENATQVTGNFITDDTGAGTDSDPEGDPLSIPATALTVTTSQGVTLTLGSDGSFTYPLDSTTNNTLSATETFTDSVTYIVTDGTLTDSATVTFTIDGENDAPVATDNSYTVSENTTQVTGNVITDDTGAGTDSDAEGDPLTIPATALTVTTSQGVTLTLGTDGSFTYPLDSNTNNTLSATETFTDSFTYTVTDGALTDSATITFTIDGENDTPVATDNTYNVGENATQVTGNFITDDTGAGTDSDPEGDPLSIPATALTVTTSQGVTLTLGSDGSFTYPLDSTTNNTLSATETFTDSVTYTVTDGTLTDTATVTFTVNGENDAPVATDNTYTVSENATQITGNVITDDTGAGTDSDPEGDPLTIPATALTVTTSQGVTLTLGTDGSFTYPLDSSINNTLSATDMITDSFTYVVTDGAITDSATITFTIDGENDTPTATDNTYTVTDNATEFTGNLITDDTGAGTDSDPEGDPLSIPATALTVTTSQGVTLTLGTDGSFTYPLDSNTNVTLSATESITDSVTYTVTDGTLTDTATVTFTVQGDNDAPVATDNTYTVSENATQITGNAITDDTGAGTDSDPEGDPLSIPATALTVTTSQGVTLTLGTDGSFTYPLDSSVNNTLSATDTITDSFTYVVTDGAITDSATITFTIDGENDTPTATDNTYTVTDNATEFTGNLITDDTGAGTDSDPEGDPLSIPATALTVTTSQGVTLTLGTDGSFTYPLDSNTNVTLSATESITDSVTYTVTDGTLTDTATVTFTVQGDNDAPVATDNTYTVSENATQITGNAITDNTGAGTDSDPEGDPLSIPATALTVTTSQGVTLTLGTDGSFTYPLDSSVNNTLSATDTITDSFTYVVTDGAITDSATITFTIDGENDTPTATDNTYTVTDNATEFTGNLITDDTGAGTDSDPEGDPLSIPATALTVTTSQGVTLTLGTDGSFTYPLDSNTNATLSATESITDSVTYTVTDGTLTDTATVTFTVQGDNDAPVATDNAYTVSENATQITGNAITDDTGAGTDSDPEGDPLSIPATALTVTTSQGVTLTLGTDGSFTYPLDSNTNNTLSATDTIVDSFTYVVTDGAITDSATITFTIDGENDAPIATDNTYTVPDNATEFTGNLITDDTGAGTDADPEGDPLSIPATALTVTTSQGVTLTLGTDGSFTYPLDSNTNVTLSATESITDSVTYTVTDGTLTDTATVTFTVQGDNDAPVATDNAYTVSENATQITGNAITDDTGAGTDSDPEGDPLSIPATALTVTTTQGVTLTLGTDGSFTYPLDSSVNNTLSATDTITDSFTYVVTDGAITDSATITFTIDGENDTPTATDNTYTVTDNATEFTGNLITDDTGAGTDSDPESDPLSIPATALTVTTSQGVTLTLGTDGSFTYPLDSNTNVTLSATESITDSVTYTVTDGTLTDTATVTFTVQGDNDAPVATDNAYTVSENATQITGNAITDDTGAGTDSDPEGDPLSIPASALTVTTSQGVTLTLGTDGSFTYPLDSSINNTLNATDTITDSFTYVVTDGTFTDSATITFTINGENDAPVALSNAYATTENNSVSGNAISEDTGAGLDFDPDTGDTLSIPASAQTVTSVNGVTITLNSDGSFTYTPDSGLNSMSAGEILLDSFTYTITDGASTDSAVVFVTVVGENDAPVATDNAYTVTESATQVTGNLITDDTGAGTDSDPEGDPLSIPATALTITTNQGVTLTLGTDGSFTYPLDTNISDTLGATETFTDSFTYTVTDGTLTDTATVSFTVNGENDAPTATINSYSVLNNNTSISGNIITDNTGSGVDSDVDANDSLSIPATGLTVTTSQGVTLTLGSDGNFTYLLDTVALATLAATGSFTDSFTYTVTDGSLNDSATVFLTVTGTGVSTVVAVDDNVTATEDINLTGNVFSNNGNGTDFDPDSDAFSVAAPGTIAVTGGGVVSIDALGAFTYDQLNSFNSLGLGQTTQATFSYTIIDTTGATDSATVTIEVQGVNDAPEATDNTYTVADNATQITGNFITDDTGAGTDADPEGDPLSIPATALTVTTSQGVTLTLGTDGSFTYPLDSNTNVTLSATESITDSVTYTVTDGTLTDTATVTFTVQGDNDAPIATDNTYTAVDNDTQVSGNVITDNTGAGTDSDPEGDPLSIPVSALTVTTSLGVTLTLGTDGSFTYPLDSNNNVTLSATESVTDSFIYTVTDGTLTDTATVTFTVQGDNDAPVATDNAYTVTETATQISGNFISDDTGAGTDSDPDGDPLSIPATALTVTTSQGVTLTLGTDGSFTYPLDTSITSTLGATESFTDSVTYTVSDGSLTDTATVTFTINGINQAPVATDNSYTTAQNSTTITGNIITDDTGAGTDSDAEGDPLSIPATALTVTTSQGVTLTLGTDGSFTYPLDSNTNFSLSATETFTDQFVYTVTDGTSIDTATITFTVQGENDAPVATDNTYTVTDNATEFTGNLITDDTGAGTDTDPEGDPLSIPATALTVTTSQGVTLTLGTDGSFTYPLDSNTNVTLSATESITDSVTYTVTDGTLTDTATVTFTVQGDNDAPVATDNTYTVTDNATDFTGNVITDDTGAGTDADPEGNPLSIPATGLVVTTSQGVTLTLGSDGSFTYPLDSNTNVTLSATESITDSFTYTVTDGTVTDTATVTFTVQGDNDAPVATDNSYTVTDNATEFSGNLITDDTGAGSDADPEGDPLSIPATALTVTTNQGVTLTLGTDGSFTYPLDSNTNVTLSATESITDSVTYIVTDGTLTDTATVTFTVQGDNDAPIATDNTYTVGDNATQITGNIIADDTGAGTDADPEGNPLSIPATGLVVTTSQGVTLTLGSDGSFTYPLDSNTNVTLSATEALTDSFTYTVTDGTLTDTATVTFTVQGDNDAPVATDNTYTVTDNATEFSGNLITDDTGAGIDADPEGDPLSIPATALTVTTSQGVTLTLGTDGSFTYPLDSTTNGTLSATESITDSVTYTVTDGTLIDTATVTFTVQGDNDAPIATDNTYTVTDNATEFSGNLITDDTGAGTDADPEGDPLSIPATALTVTTSQGVTLTLGTDGSFTYPLDSTTNVTLSATESITDSVTYTVTDGTLIDTATVTFTVQGDNDAPIATDNTYTVTDNATEFTGNLITDDTGAGTDADPEGDPLSIPATGLVVTTSQGVTLTLGTDGSFTYPLDSTTNVTLSATEAFTDSVTYTVTDGTLTDTATVTFTVQGDNDAPVATDNTYTVGENATQITGNIIADDTGAGSDTDPEADPLSIPATGLVITTSQGVTLTLGTDGSFTYPLDSNTNNTLGATDTFTDSFTYTVTDGTLTDTATITFTVQGENDAPNATDNTYTVTDNATQITGNIITDDTGAGSDTDPETDPLSIPATALTVTTSQGVTLTLGSDGSFTYPLDSNTNVTLSATEAFTDSVTYTVTDGTLTDTATVTFTVQGDNDAPVATDNTYTVGENATQITGNIITDDTGAGSDTDPEADPLSIPATGLVVTTSQGVTLTLGTDGSFTYPLDSNTNNTLGATDTFTDSFNYTVTDGTLTDTATVTFTVQGDNDAPVATDNTYTVTDNATQITGNIITDDTGAGIDADPEGDPLSIPATGLVVTTSQGVTLTLGTDGSFTYPLDSTTNVTLSATESITDSVTYTVTDGTLIDTATVTFTVQGDNDAPIATDNTYTVTDNATEFTGNLITDDTGAGTDADPEGDPLSIPATGLVVTTSQGVTLTLGTDGSFTYPLDSTTNGTLSATESITDSVTYTVTDGTLTDTATVTFTVQGDNDAPIATDNTYTVTDNATQITGNIITDDTGAGSDTDPEGDPLSIPATALTVTTSQGVTLTLGTDGSFTYPLDSTTNGTLSATESITDSVTYTVTDGTLIDTATVTFTVQGDNDAPIATDNTYTVTDNATEFTGNLITDDTGAGIDADLEGDPLSIPATALTVTTSQGVTLTLGTDGSFTYPLDSTTNVTLSATESITDSVTYTVTDGTLIDTATVTFTVQGDNDAPIATDNTYTVTDNATEFTGNLITDDTGAGTDADLEGDPLSIPATALTVTTSQGVTLTLGTDGSFTYPLDSTTNVTLSATESITDSVTYTVTDGTLTDTATVTFTVQGDNDAPTATDNTYVTVNTATQISGNLITDDTGSGIDSDPEGDALNVPATATVVTTSQGVTLTLNVTGEFTYLIDTAVMATLAGTETFTDNFVYTVTDGTLTDTALVQLTIAGTNVSTVVAVDDNFTATEDLLLNGNVLVDNGNGSDFDPESDAFSVSSLGTISATGGGIVTMNSAGNFTYDQLNNFNSLAVGETAQATFSYTIIDTTGATDNATVTIEVQGVNDTPTATDNTYTVADNATQITGNIISDDTGAGIDSDPEGDPLSIPATALTVTTSQGVTLTLGTDGSFTYPLDSNTNVTLSATESITDSVTYTVTDGTLTDTATVTFTVQGDNDAPTATANAYTEDNTATQVTGNIITDDTGAGTDADPESDPLSIPATALTVTTSQGVTLTLGTDGSFTYLTDTVALATLSGTETFTDSFTYTVTDGTLTDTATVTITIDDAANLPPNATNNGYTVNEEATAISGNVITDNTGAGTDSDPNVGDILSIPTTGLTVTTSQGITLTLSSDGNFTYTLDTAANNTLGVGEGPETFTDSFVYTVTDGSLTDTALVTFTVEGIDDAPVATDNDYTVNEEATIITGNLRFDDTGDGIDFDPEGDFFFVPPGTVLTAQGVTLALNSQGLFTYTLDTSVNNTLSASETFTDSFTYFVRANGLDSNTALVTLTVQGLNDAPTATDNTYTVADNATQITGNIIADDTGAGTDSDPESDPLTIPATALTVTTSQGVTLTLGTDGSFTYPLDSNTNVTLSATQSITDSFTYTVTDGTLTDTATVSLTIQGDNDAPNATANAYSAENTATQVTGNIITDDTGAGTDSDPESDPLSIPATALTVTTNQGVNLTLGTDGSFTYLTDTVALATLSGTQTFTDSFIYTVTDGTLTDTATVTITVSDQINLPPNATNNGYTVNEEATSIAGNVITDDTGGGTDSDPDSDPLSIPATGLTVTTSQGVTLTLNSDGNFTYPLDTVANNTLGATESLTDSFVYTVTDGTLTDTATVTLTINGVNDAPIATNNTFVQTLNQTAASGNVITDNTGNGADSDVDANDTLSIPATGLTVTTAQGVTLTLGSDGSFTYVFDISPSSPLIPSPPGTLLFTDSFTYTVTDGLVTDTATVFLSAIEGTTTPPIATDNSYNTDEDATQITGNVITDDTGVGSDSTVVAAPLSIPATALTVTTNQGVTLTLNSDGSFTYLLDSNVNDTLSAGEILTDSFIYTVFDTREVSTATVNLTIEGLNDAPVATNNAYTGTEDNTSITGNVITDDSGSGTDTDVDASNTLSIPATALTVTTLNSVTVTLDSSGNFTYPLDTAINNSMSPTDSFTDSFVYTVTDGTLTDTALVTFTITGINDAPIAVENTYTATEDVGFNFTQNVITDDTGAGVDSDPENDPISIEGGGASGTTSQGGTFCLQSDGVAVYSPGSAFQSLADGQTATDTFTYTITDGSLTDSAVVTIIVSGLNDAPVATDNSYTVADNATEITGNVISDNTGAGTDSDPEGDPLSIPATALTVTTSQGVTLTLGTDGSFTYPLDSNTNVTLSATESITDSVTYTVTDGTLTDTATVTFTVQGDNDSPNATANIYSEDNTATQVSGNVITDDTGAGTDSDPEGDPLSIPATALTVTTSQGVTLTLGTDGSFTYLTDTVALATLSGTQTFTDSFTYTVTDGTLTDSATVSITIDAVANQPPNATNNDYTVNEEATAISGNVITDNTGAGTDSDPNVGDILSIPATGLTVTTSQGITLTLSSDGNFTYALDTAANNTLGISEGPETFTDSFVYTVTDGSLTDTALVTFTVEGIDDAPVATDNDYTVNEEATVITGNLIFDDTGDGIDFDPEGDFIFVPPGTVLTAQGVTLSLNSQGLFTYTLDTSINNTLSASETFTDSFTYFVRSDGLDSNTALVTLTVQGLNDAPVATDNAYTGTEDDTNITGNVITDNSGSGIDTDVDASDTLSIPATGLTATTLNGVTVTLDSNGNFTYPLDTAINNSMSPTDSFTDSFVYTVTDGTLTDTALVTFTITGINDAPIAIDNTYTATEDVGFSFTQNVITDNTGAGVDSDPENDPISIEGGGASGTTSQGGTFCLQSDGVAVYSPGSAFQSLADGQTATDTFTYTITDGSLT